MRKRALGAPPYPPVAVEESRRLKFSAETFSVSLKGGLGERGRPLVSRLVLIPALDPDPGFSTKKISTMPTVQSARVVGRPGSCSRLDGDDLIDPSEFKHFLHLAVRSANGQGHIF